MTTKYRIKPKRDFGGRPFMVNGQTVQSGFVVVNETGCNIMPGATWFLTIADAMHGLKTWIDVGFSAKWFWLNLRNR